MSDVKQPYQKLIQNINKNTIYINEKCRFFKKSV